MTGDTLAGYRLLRTLGSGSRAHVYLASTRSVDRDDLSNVGDRALTKLVAIKHFHTAGDDRMVKEAEVLSAAAGEHIVQLLDVATLVDQRRCLVLEWLPSGSLARLLTRRPVIVSGEAVTILAPLALALDSLHRSGVTHGNISAQTVLLSGNGAPTFASFGHAEWVGPNLSVAARGSEPRVEEDRRRFSSLARVILDRVVSRDTAPLRSWLAESESSTLPDDFGVQLAHMLFRCAAPVPISRDRPPSPVKVSAAFVGADHVTREIRTDGTAADGAAAAGGDDATDGDDYSGSGPQRLRTPWLHSINLPDWIETAIAQTLKSAGGASVVASTARRLIGAHPLSFRALLSSLRRVRRRTWLLALAVLVSLVCATALLGGEDVGGDDVGGEYVGGEGKQSASGAEIPPDEMGAARTLADEGTVAVMGDDPLAAVVVLLAARNRCLAEMSILCLDAVAQQGSSVMVEDVATIRAMSQGVTPTSTFGTIGTMTASELVLLERLGDSALVGAVQSSSAENKPASFLVMRGETGWLLRTFID